MKIIDVEQGTPEWLEARMGIPTASEFDKLIGLDWTPKTGQMRATYKNVKLAEKWRGEPLPTWNGGAMEQGSIKEGHAVPWYELEYHLDVRRVGFITTDDGLVGCSPDGLIYQGGKWTGGGIEVKCPEIQTHIGYLLGRKLPNDYVQQVHGSMYVTGAKWWRFLSYCPGLPEFLLTVERDEAACEAIGEVVGKFARELKRDWDFLVEKNGGEPARSNYRTAVSSDGTITRTMRESQQVLDDVFGVMQ